MTTMIEKAVECSICGEKSNHTVIRSTNSFGSHDLDRRPPEMPLAMVAEETEEYQTEERHNKR
jgi:hypothetical protein